MLADAAYLLIGAATIGALLAVVQLQHVASPPIPWYVGAVHGMIGASGTILMLAAPARAAAAAGGAQGFRAIAAVLLVLALMAGLWIFRARVTKRPLSFGVVGVHALLAISGVVLLGAYLATG
jgi:hypothetical protein